MFWHIFWHSIWHIFWHSIWHMFWHSIWPLRSGSAHWDLELAVEVRQCPLLSGSRGWGPAVPTATWKSRLRSGSAHCDLEVAVGKSRLRSGSAHWDLELAVEVRQCPLGSGARGGGPAVPTGIWTARRRTRRRWRRRRRRRRTALIKSNNPNLAGGEKTFDSRLTKNCAETHLLQPVLGPMFKRIFRPKHKLFKNQPNTNIMLFISVPSPTRPSQKKNWNIPEKTMRSFQQGTVFHIFLHWFPPFMTKNWSLSKNTK